MTQQVTITYKDDKTLNLLVSEEEMDAILEHIKDDSSCFYIFNKEAQVGVWSHRDEVRHVIVQPFVEVKDESEKGDSECIEALPSGDGDCESGEAVAIPEGESCV